MRPTVTEDRGAATILVIALSGVLLVTGAAATAVGGLVVAQRRAQAAADLAALAGADALVAGPADPCAAAAAVAAANDAWITDCGVEGREVVVEVGVEALRWSGPPVLLNATGRAGPARGVDGRGPPGPVGVASGDGGGVGSPR